MTKKKETIPGYKNWNIRGVDVKLRQAFAGWCVTNGESIGTKLNELLGKFLREQRAKER